MPFENEKSPAVSSVEQERARQREMEAKAELDTGIEDSFPASDPISMTSTGVSSGRVDTTEAELVRAAAGNYSASAVAGVRKDARSLIGDLRGVVRENPFAAVGIVAAISFIYGATR
jgi:hypothetical protein